MTKKTYSETDLARNINDGPQEGPGGKKRYWHILFKKYNHNKVGKKPANYVSNIVDLYLKGRFSEETEREVWDWFAGESHQAEKDEALHSVWQQLDLKPDAKTIAAYNKVAGRLGMPQMNNDRGRKLFTRKLILRAAAVLIPVIVFVGGYHLFFSNGGYYTEGNDKTAFTELSVPSGVREQITLADSSRVWVNQESVLAYAENFGEQREVTLAGEARFSVAKDEQHPFSVQTEHLRITVLGTEFNVEAAPNSTYTQVTLYSGRIAVEVGDRHFELAPRQMLRYDHPDDRVTITAFDCGQVGDWRAGEQTFSSATLVEILQSLESTYGVTLMCDGLPLGGDRYDVSFTEGENLETVLLVLRKLTGRFDYEIDGDIIKIINY